MQTAHKYTEHGQWMMIYIHERGAEFIITESQKETGFTDSTVSKKQQFDFDIIWLS